MSYYNYDYWKTTTIVEHEQKIRKINNRILNGERVNVKAEIAHIFNENNTEFEADEQLEGKINSMISPKMRNTLSMEAYFALREKIRAKILGSPIEEAKKEAEEDARITGKTCIFCGSTEISSKGSEWLCKSCGRRFRKR